MGIIIRLVITAVSLWIATLVIGGIELNTDSTTGKIGTLLAVAVIFGIVNAILRPIIKTIGCGLYVLTLGLIAVVPPGRAFEIAPGSALHPLLVVVDVGPVGADSRPGADWQATLVVRDDFGAADVDVASRADLLVLQPLRPEEATLLGGALGLGEVAQWMTRIRPDMVGVVNRRAVRWAALAETPIEGQLIGAPTR